MLSKKLFMPVMAVVVAGATLFGASRIIQAQSNNTPLSGLAQEIASKFKLSQSDVQNVILSYTQQHKQTMLQNVQQRLGTRLDQEVSSGKITKDQKTAIINELETLKTKYNINSLKTMTPAQRQQAFQNEQSDLKSWAQSSGIDLSIIQGFGMGRHRGFGFGMKPKATPTP